MLNRVVKCIALTMFIMMLSGPLAYGQGASSGDGWEIRFAPYAWLIGIDGDMTVKGMEQEVDLAFRDLVENLDIVLTGHLEVWKGPLGGFVDANYGKLSMDEKLTSPVGGSIDIDVELEFTITEFGILYHVGHWPIRSGERRIFADVLLGGRAWWMEGDLDIGPGSGSKSTSWVDGIVGARTMIELAEKVPWTTRVDFGAGGSDFSWNLQTLFGYLFTERISAWAGYRWLYVDYEEGSGGKKFAMDATFYGPVIGALFIF